MDEPGGSYPQEILQLMDTLMNLKKRGKIIIQSPINWLRSKLVTDPDHLHDAGRCSDSKLIQRYG